MIDLTLKSLLIPDIIGYEPPFGTKITRTPENKGGLSTRQVNDNILLPFAKQRAVVIEQSDTISQIEYDAKIILKNTPEGGGYNRNYRHCISRLYSYNRLHGNICHG